MPDTPLVQISIHGAPVVIISNQVYAALVPPPNATTWVASAGPGGTLVFADQASGLVLGAPDTDPGTQAVAAPPGAPLAVASWQVTEFSDDDEDDPKPVTDPGQLQSGYYSIQAPDGGGILYRNRIEDRSLLPKRVALQSPGQDQGPLIIQVVGDDD